MHKGLSLLIGSSAAAALGSNQYLAPQVPIYQAQAAPAAPAMDPLMMMLLFKDDDSSDDSSLKKLLPLMMMNGGLGGAGGMNPMMMMALMDDDSDDSLLPLLMMGGMGGAGGAAGGMNPMMMMALMGDDCSVKNTATKAFAFANGDSASDTQKDLASGKKFYTGSTPTAAVASDVVDTVAANAASAAALIDYDYIKCKQGGGMSDLLPLMMMGGGAGMGGMDPMMMMLMLDDSGDMGDLLPLMMMGGMGGSAAAPGAPAMDPMMMMLMMDDDSDMKDLLPLMMMGGMGGAGAAGGMNPLMLLSLLGDDDDSSTKTAEDCNKEIGLETAFVLNTGANTLTKVTSDADIRGVFAAQVGTYPDISTDGVAKDFNSCVTSPTTYKFGGSSGLSDLLPLMMMGGGQGMGGMDPMMMMMLLKD